MARLSTQIRTFITQKLACFESPSAVVESVKRQYGCEVSRQLVEAHDPTKHAGRNLGRKYRAIFEATQQRFLEATAEIPIVHKAVRLQRLQDLVDRAEERQNLKLAGQLLELAAKEANGWYTNAGKHQYRGRGGDPIKQENRVTRVDPGRLSRGTLEQVRGRGSKSSQQEQCND